MSSHYIYRGLSADDSIRLLELLPGRLGDPLTARLHEVHLSSQPQFCALSYCWGAPDFTMSLELDGLPFLITKSLADALQHIRDEVSPLIIWIDQVCINQRDIPERNAQVHLMSRIYASAREVKVWLGVPSSDSDFVMRCLNRGEVQRNDIPRLYCAVTELLLERPWFERLWTHQEVVLASNDPQIICGFQSIPWSRFFKGSDILKCRRDGEDCDEGMFPTLDSTSLRDQDAWRIFLGRMDTADLDTIIRDRLSDFVIGFLKFNLARRARDTGPSMGFALRLFATRYLKATDLRDKIFSLLGICSFESAPMTVDYSKSVTRVYSETMVYLILHDFTKGFPEHFIAAQLPVWSVELNNVPSWVPNFAAWSQNNIQVTLSLGLQDLFPDLESILKPAITRASRCAPIARFSADLQKLYTRGTELGIIVESFRLPHVASTVANKGNKWCRWIAQTSALAYGRNIPPSAIVETLKRPYSARSEDWGAILAAYTRLRPSVREANTDNLSSMSHDDYELFNTFAAKWSLSKTLFVTNTGRIGICLGTAAKGDVLAGLFEINAPFVLRRKGGVWKRIKKVEEWTMISAAHVSGHSYRYVDVENTAANGHAVDVDWYKRRDFTIV